MSQQEATPAGATDRSELDEQVLRQLQIWLPLVTVVAAVGCGLILGPGFAVLVLAFSALMTAIATFWWSLRALFGDTTLSGEEAFAIGAPSAEQEQKRAVLRAIKDLQFEHGVGKISDDDFRILIARYRAEAKRLLRVLDDQAAPRRKLVEKLVNAHLAKEGLAELDDEEEEEEEDAIDADEDDAVEEETPGVACPVCRADNDDDAAFCKKCGRRMHPEPRS